MFKQFLLMCFLMYLWCIAQSDVCQFWLQNVKQIGVVVLSNWIYAYHMMTFMMMNIIIIMSSMIMISNLATTKSQSNPHFWHQSPSFNIFFSCEYHRAHPCPKVTDSSVPSAPANDNVAQRRCCCCCWPRQQAVLGRKVGPPQRCLLVYKLHYHLQKHR
jgi:hypothetical protein